MLRGINRLLTETWYLHRIMASTMRGGGISGLISSSCLPLILPYYSRSRSTFAKLIEPISPARVTSLGIPQTRGAQHLPAPAKINIIVHRIMIGNCHRWCSHGTGEALALTTCLRPGGVCRCASCEALIKLRLASSHPGTRALFHNSLALPVAQHPQCSCRRPSPSGSSLEEPRPSK